MTRTSLLAVLALCAPSFAQGFELVADFNNANQTVKSSEPELGTDGTSLGATAIFKARTTGIDAAPFASVQHLYGAALGQPAERLTGATVLNDLAVVNGGLLYFQAKDPLLGYEIFVSDGTAAGTHVWAEAVPGPGHSDARPRLAVPGGFVFTTRVGFGPYELYFTGGAPGSALKLTNMSASDKTADMGAFHWSPSGRLYFTAHTSEEGVELWVSDGSFEGAQLLADLAPGTSSCTVIAFAEFGGLTYFTLSNQATSQHELWATDGTAANTQLVSVIGGQFADVGELAVHAGKLFVSAKTTTSGAELWSFDGPAAAPVVWTAVNAPGSLFGPRELTNLGGKLLFTLPSAVGANSELYVLGTSPLTEQKLDLHAGTPSKPSGLVADGGRVYFAAEEPVHGRELWSTDGTLAGTQLEADLTPGPAGSGPSSIAAVPGGLLFAASAGGVGTELFQLAGGIASLHTDIEAGFTNDSLDPLGMQTLFARDLAFAARSPLGGNLEPHMLVGGATLVALGDLFAGSLPSNPADFVGLVQGGQKRVFFTATIGAGLRDVIVSDGTLAGTHAIGVHSATPNAGPKHLTALGETLFYVAKNAQGERELWRTDGTALGTQQVTQPGPLGERAPADLVVAGGWLYFSALDDAGYRNVFRTQGAGAVQVSFQTSDVERGVEQLANVRGRVVFVERGPSGAHFVVHDPVTGTQTQIAYGQNFTITTNQVDDPLHAPSVRGPRYFVFGHDDIDGHGFRSLDIDTNAVTVHGSTTSGQPLQPTDGHSLRFIGSLGYFVGEGPKGIELYRLGLAPHSTQFVFNAAGYSDSVQAEQSGFPRELTAVGNDVYFGLLNSDDPSLALDVLTTSGGLVTSACDVSAVAINPPGDFALAGGALYFSVDFYQWIGRELCRRPELGAHVVDFGTSGSGGVLDVDTPLMGASSSVYVRNQAPGTVTTLWLSGNASGPIAGLTMPSDALWLDPSTARLTGFSANTDFTKSIPVPVDAALVNASFVLQAVMVDPLSPGALRTTNAKLVTLGY